ncbi:hypothetical protein ASC92_05520 [Variovorax sp. Root411]|nr:hypothetical protein ASC92_05520 [Variovorax sp. Root411]
MDEQIGDIAEGNVHVRNGKILAVGKSLKVPAGVERINARGAIVLPGLVETHWHMWNTLLRSMAGRTKEKGYFPLSEVLGKAFLPSDMHVGVTLAASEALHSGITTVHDWCHNTLTPAHVDSDIEALRRSGIRARFSYGYPQGLPRDQAINLDDLRRVKGEHFSGASDGLLTLGYAARGTRYPGAYRKEWEFAREMGLPISVHANIARAFGNVDEIEVLARDGFLDQNLQVIHALTAPPAAIEALAKAGASVSLSPHTEMRMGFGLPQTGNFLAAGVRVTLSVDTTALSGNADMFTVMKAIENVENAQAENEFKLDSRRVLQMATIDGARGLGLGDRIGSLTPGKQADLIVIRTDEINMAPLTDAAELVVHAANPSNVEVVMVDGRVLKRGGRLSLVDTAALAKDAAASLRGVKQRANWG